MRTCCIIAKGPSAMDAPSFVREGEDVATINDAGWLLPGRPLRWCFFSEVHALPSIRGVRDRVHTFVSRSQDSRHYPKWFREFQRAGKHVEYPDQECCGDDLAMAARIIDGGIVHHATTTGAMHWLAKHGRYDCLRIIGVDGGEEYAQGVRQLTAGQFPLDEWRDIARRLGAILHRIYGTRVEWSSK